MKLRFETKTILARLKANRGEHMNIVHEAQAGFREKWSRMLQSAIADVNEGKRINPRLNLSVPENHTDDFDRAIEMLEMTTETEIELPEDAFQAYVRNKWAWQGRFLESNSAYSESAASLMDR